MISQFSVSEGLKIHNTAMKGNTCSPATVGLYITAHLSYTSGTTSFSGSATFASNNVLSCAITSIIVQH